MATIDESEKQEIPSEDENFDITSDNVVAEEPVTEIEATSEPSEPDEDTSETVSVDETIAEPAEVATVPESPVEEVASQTEAALLPAKPRPVVAKSASRVNWLRLGMEAALVVAIVVLAVILANVTTDKHNLTKQLASAKANPQNLVQQQTNSLIAQVSTLMQLPTGETPTVAQVSDATAAKKQSAFFKNAQNGDKVLLYVKAGEAILYRPSTNKIVLVAPLTFSNTTPGTTAK